MRPPRSPPWSFIPFIRPKSPRFSLLLIQTWPRALPRGLVAAQPLPPPPHCWGLIRGGAARVWGHPCIGRLCCLHGVLRSRGWPPRRGQQWLLCAEGWHMWGTMSLCPICACSKAPARCEGAQGHVGVRGGLAEGHCVPVGFGGFRTASPWDGSRGVHGVLDPLPAPLQLLALGDSAWSRVDAWQDPS